MAGWFVGHYRGRRRLSDTSGIAQLTRAVGGFGAGVRRHRGSGPSSVSTQRFGVWALETEASIINCYLRSFRG